MNVSLGPKFASELTIFFYFSISSLLYVLVQRPSSWCWRPVCITVSHHLAMVTVGQGMYALPVDYSEKLSDSIATSDINSVCYMLFLFLFALLLFVCFIFLFFCLLFLFFFFFFIFRDSNKISISTVEFRYYVVIIVLVNLGKPSSVRD